MNKCPKCGAPIRIHVPLMLCCEPQSVPVSDDSLVAAIKEGKVQGLGVNMAEVAAHCVRCDWKAATQSYLVELPVEEHHLEDDEDEERPLNKLLN